MNQEAERDLTLADARERIDRILETLTHREREIVKLRFGVGVRMHTLEEVGRIFDICVERVRQIESKAIRKLQHPVRERRLEQFYVDLLLDGDACAKRIELEQRQRELRQRLTVLDSEEVAHKMRNRELVWHYMQSHKRKFKHAFPASVEAVAEEVE